MRGVSRFPPENCQFFQLAQRRALSRMTLVRPEVSRVERRLEGLSHERHIFNVSRRCGNF